MALQQCGSSHFRPADDTFGRVGEELSPWAGRLLSPDTASHMGCCSGTGPSTTVACRTGLERDLCSPLEQTQRQNTSTSTSEQIDKRLVCTDSCTGDRWIEPSWMPATTWTNLNTYNVQLQLMTLPWPNSLETLWRHTPPQPSSHQGLKSIRGGGLLSKHGLLSFSALNSTRKQHPKGCVCHL